MAYTIMVVEDEKDIRDILGKYLMKEGYDIVEVKDGFEALGKFTEKRIHLIILDVMMPGIDGFEVLQEVRKISNIPVLMLTAKQDEVDRLLGFDLGADDYVLKPFSPKEVIKRVEVLIRRIYGQAKQMILKEGALELHIGSQKLYKNNEDIPITATEFDLLQVFFQNLGRVLSREQLINKALGLDYEGYDRSIDTYIKRIRQKIEEDTKKPQYLRTKYGAGYIFGGNDYDH
ncbi:MAG: response regulator transcription factor [Eubacteriales bacterium]